MNYINIRSFCSLAEGKQYRIHNHFIYTHAKGFSYLVNKGVDYYVKHSNYLYDRDLAYLDAGEAVGQAKHKMRGDEPEQRLIGYFTLCVRRRLFNGVKKVYNDRDKLRLFSNQDLIPHPNRVIGTKHLPDNNDEQN